MTKVLFAFLLSLSAPAMAYQPGEFFVDPHVAVGYNVAQGTNFMFGVDIGYGVSDQIAAGVGAQYSAGKRPEHDQAMGAGPFVTFFQPLTSFLVFSVREDISYLDQRNPYVTVDAAGGETWSHTKETGVASVTSVGLHLNFTPNLGVSAGYRAVIALSNSDIARDRSGTFLGVSIGI